MNKINSSKLKTDYEVLEFSINYKNSDYTPEFYKDRLIGNTNNLYNIVVNCVFNVNQNLVYNVNRIKRILKNITIEHNNLEYDLIFENSTDLEIGENSVILVSFNCKGKIYKKRVTKTIRNGDILTFNSNKDVYLNLSIDKTTVSSIKTVTLNNIKFKYNSKTGFKIDAENGIVTGLVEWDFFDFPTTKDNKFTVSLSGIESLNIDYREVV